MMLKPRAVCVGSIAPLRLAAHLTQFHIILGRKLSRICSALLAIVSSSPTIQLISANRISPPIMSFTSDVLSARADATFPPWPISKVSIFVFLSIRRLSRLSRGSLTIASSTCSSAFLSSEITDRPSISLSEAGCGSNPFLDRTAKRREHRCKAVSIAERKKARRKKYTLSSSQRLSFNAIAHFDLAA